MKNELILDSKEILKQGSKGVKVEQLQRILNTLNFNPGNIDGDFENHTLVAVKQFQEQQGIDADGIVGMHTQNALNKALDKTLTTNLQNLNISIYGSVTGKLPLCGVVLIKEFEGLYLQAYPDPLSGGKPITIGWGSTRKKDIFNDAACLPNS
ncbi:MAG: hypothetical protein F6K62_04930 [Sphaerospermopsis sp. SIO1G2]|nr:hypothetical protein [Sphaerospermopsis sp. SIO1G2]